MSVAGKGRGGEDDLGEWSGIFACCPRMVKAGEEVMSGEEQTEKKVQKARGGHVRVSKGPEVHKGVCILQKPTARWCY